MDDEEHVDDIDNVGDNGHIVDDDDNKRIDNFDKDKYIDNVDDNEHVDIVGAHQGQHL